MEIPGFVDKWNWAHAMLQGLLAAKVDTITLVKYIEMCEQ